MTVITSACAVAMTLESVCVTVTGKVGDNGQHSRQGEASHWTGTSGARCGKHIEHLATLATKQSDSFMAGTQEHGSGVAIDSVTSRT